MTDISIGRRIACVASAGAVVASAIIAAGAVISLIYLLYLGWPYVQDAALWLWGMIPHGEGLGAMLLRVAIGLALTAGVLVLLAFIGFDLLVLAVLAALPLLVMYALTGDLKVAAGTFGTCMVLGVIFLMSVQTTPEGTFGAFRRTAWEKPSMTTLSERCVYANRKHIGALTEDLSPYPWVVLVGLVTGLLTYGFLFLPFNSDLDADSLAKVALALSLAVIVAMILMWAASFQIWKMLDERLDYGDDSYFFAAGLATLGPVGGASLGTYLYHSYEGAIYGFVIGCFAYTVLGGIFSCEKNLFEILKRRVTRT